MSARTSPEFFESLYRSSVDPWDFATSDYERQRYAALISALSDRTYLRAFEPGCSIGILTAQLAPICKRLTAMDISSTAVQRAKEHCQGFSNVELIVGSLPKDMPSDLFDLIVFSEIGYYFRENDLIDLGALLISQLERDGVLIAVHWLGDSADHNLSGDEVHQILDKADGLRQVRSERHEGFRLNKWVRV